MSDACERIFTEILESESLVNIKGLPREAKYYIVDRLMDLMIKLTKLSVKEVLEVIICKRSVRGSELSY